MDQLEKDWKLAHLDIFDINWAAYGEEQLHKLFELYYLSLDFDVKNLHESDRSNEGGADLVVSKSGESIALAVKVKPRKQDYAQALELSERKEKNKIYYYVRTPTNDFIQKTARLKRKVRFKTMRDFLIECFDRNPRLYFELIIGNMTDLYLRMALSSYYLLCAWRLRESRFKGSKTKLSRKAMQQLWRLKDTAVQINKTADNLRTFYDGYKLEHKADAAKRFIIQMQTLESALKGTPQILEDFCKNNKSFLAHNARETALDSDWMYLGAREGLRPTSVEKYIEDYKATRNNFEKMGITRSTLSSDFSEIFDVILTHLWTFGWALETRVDNFFKQANGETFERNKR